MRVADYVMLRLAEENIHDLFMITGRGILYLSDAAAKNDKLNCICMHHEQAVGFAAMAYSQSSLGMGACLVSTGCASTNVVTPLLCAWQDEVPFITVCGQNTLNETVQFRKASVRTFGQQEADIVSIVRSITKYAVMLERPEDIAYELDKAFFYAQEGRKGPVLLDIPLDIQNARIEPEKLRRFVVPHDSIPYPDLTLCYELLKNSVRPVMLLGAGAFIAKKEIACFVKKYQIPVVYETNAVNVYSSENKLSVGAVGTMAANRAGNFAVQNADIIIAVGAKLSSMTVGNDKSKFAREAKLIVVDIDDTELSKDTVNHTLFVRSNLKDFFVTFQLDYIIPEDWIIKCLHWKNIFPKCEEKYHRENLVDLHVLSQALSNLLDEDAVFVTDAGLEELITPTVISFKTTQLCIQPASQGAMGYALPAAIGAWYSCKRQVVLVTGDGSIMMNIQELQTVVHNNIPIKIIIVNNNCYSVIRKRQKDLFRSRTIGTDFENGVSCPSYKKVAECFGIRYTRIENEQKLYESLEEVLSSDGPVICEVMAPEEQGYLHSSYARTKTNRFVQRPLEDQSPFLDRELFLSEMIVSPIDQ